MTMTVLVTMKLNRLLCYVDATLAGEGDGGGEGQEAGAGLQAGPRVQVGEAFKMKFLLAQTGFQVKVKICKKMGQKIPKRVQSHIQIYIHMESQHGNPTLELVLTPLEPTKLRAHQT